MSKRFNRDDIDKFLDYEIYVPSRTVYMGSVKVDDDGNESGTDAAMAERTIKSLHVLESLAPNGDQPINIIMNNPGGCEYSGLAIYDAIKACKNHVTIKVFGHAMSMGSVILQAADDRVMSPNSRMMIHYGTWGISDHPKIVYKWAEEGKKFDSIMEQIYMEKILAKNPGFKLKKLQEMLNFDTFLTAKEAVALGLADSVLE